MSEIYLAKSDLTGAVYAVKGRSKTDVTQFVTDLIAIETADLKAENARMRTLLERFTHVNKQALDIIKREGFVFDHSGGRWEKLAFTFYSDLVAIATDARHVLEQEKEDG